MIHNAAFRKKALCIITILATVLMISGINTKVSASAVNDPAATTEIQPVSESERLFASARKVGVLIAQNKFKYGKSRKTNFLESVSRKRSYCADYVTWALQENGDLSYSKRIAGSRNGNLTGNGRAEVLKTYKLIRVNKRTSRVAFQPGDIVCVYKISGKYGWHFMIFASYNKNGKPLWYSGGSDATKANGCYSRRKLTTPRRLAYYERSKTAFILRRK